MTDTLRDWTKVTEITFAELKRGSFTNSLPGDRCFSVNGQRKRWVGIGFIDEGDLEGDEILVID